MAWSCIFLLRSTPHLAILSYMSTYTVDQITNLLATSNFAVERALIVLYERQTADEQSAEVTSNKNGVGFTAFDAPIFSSFAKQIIDGRISYVKGSRLTEKQFNVCRKLNKNGKMKIGKYARQLCEIANEKTMAAAA